jgi:hypothetical protein
LRSGRGEENDALVGGVASGRSFDGNLDAGFSPVVVCCQVVSQVLDALWNWCPDGFLVVDFG